LARKELGKDKIFVLGHSWGSFLGLQLAQRRPEWLYA
jgi:proline iminopeptidase